MTQNNTLVQVLVGIASTVAGSLIVYWLLKRRKGKR
jgi:hypothetical protein